jgi:hypothetical protein
VSLGLQGLVASEIKSGLQPGDVVIDDPKVRAGQRVRTQLQPLPTTGGAADGASAAAGRNEVAGAPR